MSKELFGLLLQVLKSWQVLAITIGIVLYLYLVFYVARTNHRPRSVSRSKPRKQKAAPEAVIVEESGGNSSTNDELGLEEA